MSDRTTASWQHRALVRTLRLLRANGMFTEEKLPAAIAKLTAKPRKYTPSSWMLRHVRTEQTDRAGWPMFTLSPTEGGSSARVVVAIHGGAYIAEVTFAHWLTYADIVRRTGATVVVPIYPLAPRGIAEVVVPQVADLVAELMAKHRPEAISVLGDSAGAGLALAAMQDLVARGGPTPGQMVLISPWLDATVRDPASATIDDPILDAAGLRAAGRLWAGDLDLADSRVSPLFGSLEGLPATVVYAGSLDLLYPDTLRLQSRALEEERDIRFVLRDGLMHGWATGFSFLPEARAVRDDLYGHLVAARGAGVT